MALEEEEGGLTFSLDVGGDGEAALRNTIMNKLSDFMGSYTDDVLAEYVVVLVSHGKQRAQAVKDLEAFLGDQSESFVTWLWEHLAANMHLYTSASNASSTKPDLVDMEPLGEGRNEEVVKSSEVTTQRKDKSHDNLPPHGGGRLISLKSNTTRQDAGSATLRATQVDLSGSVRSLSESTRRGAKRQRSPESGLHSETAISEKQKAPRVRATMRLLQSAVREAVAPTSGHSKRSVREAAAPVREARAPMREVRASVRVSTASTDSHSRQSESALKRLQSVVSSDFENSEVASLQQPLKDARRPNSVRQGKKAMPAIMMAMKAAAAAAEDVTKVRGRLGGNIWDRLGKKTADFEDSDDEEDVRYGEENKEAVEDRLEDRYTSYYEDEYDHKKARLESEDMLSEGSIEDGAVVSGSVFDEYTGQSMSSRNVYPVRGDKYHEDEWNGEDFVNDDKVEDGEDIRSDRRRRRKEESVTVEYRLARNTDGVKESHKPKGSGTSSGLSNSSQKIVNISVNVNTWKPEAYDKVKDTGGSEQPALLSNQEQSQEQLTKGFPSNMISAPPGPDTEEDGVGDLHTATASKPVREVQPEANDLSAKPPVTTKEAPKATPSAIIPAGVKPVRKVDDAESRTVFVTNIHFAASKESVMAHFASCGDIGRIIMLTDGATGQPKGSAYIEFKVKEASDRALALNDSSFYSRPLKVVRKDAAIQAIPLLHPALIHRRTLPLTLRLPAIGARLYRGAPYLVQQPRRFPAMPRPYGNFPSLQWKRDGPAAGNTTRPPGFNMPVRPVRSNSYVRASGPQPLKAGEEITAVPAQGGEETKTEGVAREQGDVQMEQV